MPNIPLRAASVTGLILAGGRSSRMGQDKAWLDWRGRPLLRHIVDRLQTQLTPLIVVRQKGQELPDLPVNTILTEDAESEQGPLRGLQAGLRLVPPDRPVFVTGCDYPFIDLLRVASFAVLLGDAQAVVPRIQGQPHPLAAVYHPAILPRVDETLGQRKRSMMALLDQLNVRWVEEDQWRAMDDTGFSLRNVNTLDEYKEALRLVEPIRNSF